MTLQATRYSWTQTFVENNNWPLASESYGVPSTTLNASCVTLEAVRTCLQSKSTRLTGDGDTAQPINAGSFSSNVRDRVDRDHDGKHYAKLFSCTKPDGNTFLVSLKP